MNLIARIPSIRIKLLIISGTGTALLLTAALFGLWLSWNSLQFFEDDVQKSTTDERAILIMQTDFKKQVQEWKDTLLRGSDPVALDKHWSNFENQERKVQESGLALQARLTDPKAKELIGQLSQEYRQSRSKAS